MHDVFIVYVTYHVILYLVNHQAMLPFKVIHYLDNNMSITFFELYFNKNDISYTKGVPSR